MRDYARIEKIEILSIKTIFQDLYKSQISYAF